MTDLIVKGKIIGHVNTVLPQFDRTTPESWHKRRIPRVLNLEELCQRLRQTGVSSDRQYTPFRLLAVCLADGAASPYILWHLGPFSNVVDCGDTEGLFAAYVEFQAGPWAFILPPRTLDEAYYIVLQELSTISDGRCVFVCDGGKLALSSRVRAHDVVCILHGCTTPVILRPVDDGRYSFVDICYFENAMAGEAVDWDVDEATELVIV